MNLIFDLPLRGYSEGVNVLDSPKNTSGDMLNIRPIDSLSRRLRLGQRPGLETAYDEQIASAAGPIVVLGSVTVVNYIGSS